MSYVTPYDPVDPAKDPLPLILFRCKKCGRMFYTRRGVIMHIRIVHLSEHKENPSKRKKDHVEKYIEAVEMGSI